MWLKRWGIVVAIPVVLTAASVFLIIVGIGLAVDKGRASTAMRGPTGTATATVGESRTRGVGRHAVELTVAVTFWADWQSGRWVTGELATTYNGRSEDKPTVRWGDPIEVRYALSDPTIFEADEWRSHADTTARNVLVVVMGLLPAVVGVAIVLRERARGSRGRR